MRLKEGIETLMSGHNIEHAACRHLLGELLNPQTPPPQIAAFLVLLRAKPETAAEIAGMVMALKEKMTPMPMTARVLDIVGTGGDGARTVNISTGSAILAASCGVQIAKHGNTAVSSQAGSADLLAALGIVIDASPDTIKRSIHDIGIGFCFAPRFHPAMRALRALRQQLNVPTTFNLLGPLLNPANPAHHVLGVYDVSILRLMAEALQYLGTQRSLVVHGHGLDELTCIGPVTMLEVTPTTCQEILFDPQEYGFPRCTVADLRGGSAATNAQILKDVFCGKRSQSLQAVANALIVNAAMAVYIYGLQPTIATAIVYAKEQLLNGAAMGVLNAWRMYDESIRTDRDSKSA
ncbi:MAG: anthranilate phosphoribosyltransferase [Gammaproteobacteria bacterium]|nr:anthranilate phosphoribosyltransferase [Gammaproteobacteria bacterium]